MRSLTLAILVVDCASGAENAVTAPVLIPAIEPQRPATIVAGGRHTCRLVANGTAYCWGDGSSGQLGSGSLVSRMTPTLVPSPPAAAPFSSLAAGEFSTCALSADGAAYCWGQGTSVEGTDTAETSLQEVPALVETSQRFLSLASGYYHACGLTSAGAAYCWGSGFSGQLGDGSTVSYRPSPTAVVGDTRFVSATGGYWHSCALTLQGTVYCWGNNNWAQLGDSTRTAHNAPALVTGTMTFAKVSAGGRHTCGLGVAGEAYCWGWNAFGQLGDGTTATRLTAVSVRAGLLVFTNIMAGWYHTCGLTSAGAAYCWGFNSHGQLGNGTTIDRSTPTAVSGGLSFTQLALGVDHTCGVTVAGSTYCWGSNAYGQLGDGTTSDALAPRAVTGLP